MSATSSRSTVVAATFWLVVLLGNNLSASLFSGRRVRLQDLYSANDFNRRGVSYDDQNSVVSKRDGAAGGGGRGTCTCTCETKPVSSSSSTSSASQSSAMSGVVNQPQENFVPQTAALMRTGTGSRQSSTQTKSAEEPQPDLSPSQQQQQQRTQFGRGSTGIVQVPPMQDYGLNNAYEPMVSEQSNFVEPVAEPQGNHQQQTDTAEQQEAEDDWAQEKYPWKRLPDVVCFRDVCASDRECCRRFNICDRSAHVCVDCWYGSSCMSSRDCCLKYPYCERDWRTDADGSRHVVGGKCTNEL